MHTDPKVVVANGPSNRKVIHMFAEPHYLAAYRQGVDAATRVFAQRWAHVESKPLELLQAEVDRIACPMTPERLSQRLATLVLIGARNQWRYLSTQSIAQRGRS
jgi:hypothetical protein